MLADVKFDLVLALDSFPYLVEAGVAEAHIAECARVIKPSGHVLIMNWDYSTGLNAQREAVAALAGKHRFALLRNGTSDLRSWDGKAFLLKKAT
jgi:SAM-dependent methyltransferase